MLRASLAASCLRCNPRIRFSSPTSLLLVSFFSFSFFASHSFSSMASASSSTATATATATARATPAPHPPLLPRASIIPPRLSHQNTIIFLHGLGDSSSGFKSMFVEFPLPHTKVILPNAPIQPVTINGGMRMQSWYDILSMDRQNPINYAEDSLGIHRSRDAVQSLLDAEVSVIGAQNIILGGFSQGGSLAMLVALSGPHQIAGVIATSSYLLLRGSYPSILSPVSKSIPVFAYHGTDDQTVPYEIAVLSYQALQSYGVLVQFESERGLGHGVSDREMEKMLAFVYEKLQMNAKGEKKQKAEL